MLTRSSKARAGSPTRRKAEEPCSVEISANSPRPHASSVVPSGSVRSRQPGSGTKRADADGRISTSPRGASGKATGYFNIQTIKAVIQGISHRTCRILMRGDGYTYELKHSCPSRPEGRGFSEPK